MQRWALPPIAIVTGAAAAAISAAEMAPLATFAIVTVIALGASLTLHSRISPPSEPDATAPTQNKAQKPVAIPGNAQELPGELSRIVFEKLPVPLILITRRGLISFANSAAQETLPGCRTASISPIACARQPLSRRSALR